MRTRNRGPALDISMTIGERDVEFAYRLALRRRSSRPRRGAGRRRRDAEARRHLTYMIPADAPPSFDGHREETYATIHSVAPFYSVLIRANPDEPGIADDFVCDLCTEMPKPTDDGKTYTFKIRDGVKFHDGSPLTAADVAASWNKIVFPPEGVISARQSNFVMVDKIEAPDPTTVVFRLKFATDAFMPALADPFAFIYKQGDPRQGPALVREEHHRAPARSSSSSYETGQSIKGERNPDYYHQGPAVSRRLHGIFADKQATRVEAIRADRAAIEFRGLPPVGARRAETGARRQDHGADQRLELRRR